MNNKILIGVIIAVTILIGVSFTSVVGYRSVTSCVKASPLFNNRTSRAIDEEDVEDFSCEYVGKGEESILSIPKREYMIKPNKIIESIKKMDENSFSRFVDFIINYIYNDDKYKDFETKKILNVLNLLRGDTKELDKIILDRNKDNKRLNTDYSILCAPTGMNSLFICAIISLFIMLFIIIPVAFIEALIEVISIPPTFISVCCIK